MMRIGNYTWPAVNAYASAKASGGLAAEKKSAVAGKDEIVLSKPAQDFRQLLQKAQAGAAVREEKVAELSARIDSGSYRVDSELLAEKLLNFRY